MRWARVRQHVARWWQPRWQHWWQGLNDRFRRWMEDDRDR